MWKRRVSLSEGCRRELAGESLFFVEVVEDFFGGAKSVDGGGGAGINPGLQEDLSDLFACDPVVERAAHVNLDLVSSVHGRQHGQIEQAARLECESRPRPYSSPAPFRHPLLKNSGELVGAGQSAIHIVGA